MTIEVYAYCPEHAAAWDTFCDGALNATFLHSRRFLSYHGKRFNDLSLLIVTAGKIVGVFPAAVSPTDPNLVVSHPGATYGGIVHQGWLTGTRMIDAIAVMREYYGNRRYLRLLYKAVPLIYTKTPAQDDIYAMFRLGAKKVRCDLSCAIDLQGAARLVPSERRSRGLKKATKVVSLSSDRTLLGELWAVIAKNLARKHNALPVHTLQELALLMDRFPTQIAIHCALLEGRVEAGILLFISAHVWHAQYIASSERGYDVSALDAVFEAAITAARENGVRYFDFGTSNESSGLILNEGLYRFKSEFGGGGVAHEFLEISLSR